MAISFIIGSEIHLSTRNCHHRCLAALANCRSGVIEQGQRFWTLHIPPPGRPALSTRQMDVERGKAGRGNGCRKLGEESTLLSLEWKVCLAIVWLAFLTVALVAGAQWRTLGFGEGTYYRYFWQPKEGDGVNAGASAEGSGTARDKYLGGLLAPGVNARLCQSRYEAVQYRHQSSYKPSAYLVQKIREYEGRHRRCGPNTDAYKNALRLLADGGYANASSTEECKYLLWTPFSGLGNRIISVTSSFLYAMLTKRVLLIDRGRDFSNLFCEPFPGTSWLIPSDFPKKNLYFNRGDPVSYGFLVREKGIVNPLPSFVYAHVVIDYHDEDARFFFEEDQRALRSVPWLLVRSELYYAAALFLNADFEPELARMFPEREAVFHHLSRYLLHPANKVWGMITRYYQTYLARGKDRLGLQIRVFDHNSSPFEVVVKQVINCTMKEKLLPEIDPNDPPSSIGKWKIKDVVITTLYSGYLDKIRSMYWEHPAAGGVLVSVHQPSHEENQMTDYEQHDMKAWAEMNLLSFSDVLVTSAWSTFGYVGQGLGGLKPWILLKPKNAVMPDPSCIRDISMEPCMHFPPKYLCDQKMDGGKGKVAPYVTYCADVEGGLKVLSSGR